MQDDKIIDGQNQSPPASSEPPVPPDPASDHPQPIEEAAHNEPLAQVTLNVPEADAPPAGGGAMVTEETPVDETFPPPPPEAFDSSFGEHRTKFFIIGGAILFFLIAFGLIVSLFLATRNKKPENIALTFWGIWEEKEVYQPLIDEYQKNNPKVTVDYLKMTPQEYREKILTRSKTGQGPDIFRFHNTWLPQMTDVVAPIPNNVLGTGDYEKIFYAISQKDMKIGDKYYGIPLYIDGLVLAYNDNLFKQAGISTPPTTWEDVVDYASKLTVKDSSGTIITSGIALGTAENVDHFSDIFALFLVQNGADITKLDQPEAAGALEGYRGFAEGPDAFWDETMPNSTQAFIEEKVAMVIVPTWHLIAIKQANPQLALEVTSVPRIPATKQVSIATYWAEGVSKYSKNQVEAWKFLKFLSEKESQQKMHEIQARIRPFGMAYSRVDLGSSLLQNEILAPVIQEAEGMVSIPSIDRTYDNGLNDAIVTYIRNAINDTTKGISYTAALNTAKQGIAQEYEKFKIK